MTQHPRIPLLRRLYFVWLVGPSLVYGAFLAWGLPHIVFSYQYTAPPGRHYDPRAFPLRIYHRCTYWGPYGFIRIEAPNDWCPMIHFFREQDQ